MNKVYCVNCIHSTDDTGAMFKNQLKCNRPTDCVAKTNPYNNTIYFPKDCSFPSIRNNNNGECIYYKEK